MKTSFEKIRSNSKAKTLNRKQIKGLKGGEDFIIIGDVIAIVIEDINGF